jgi:hypothetical protein
LSQLGKARRDSKTAWALDQNRLNFANGTIAPKSELLKHRKYTYAKKLRASAATFVTETGQIKFDRAGK